ncbi:hypothetical protein HOY82DRAFT_605104 [Tuber indicum]|nr:hypothetical protein HOY82DRAFT_605104 [Tuber indicum]
MAHPNDRLWLAIARHEEHIYLLEYDQLQTLAGEADGHGASDQARHMLCGRLLGPFTDIICMFASDVGGQWGVFRVLSYWSDLLEVGLWFPEVVVIWEQLPHPSPSQVVDAVASQLLYDMLWTKGILYPMAWSIQVVEVSDADILAHILTHCHRARRRRRESQTLYSLSHMIALFRGAWDHSSTMMDIYFNPIIASRYQNLVPQTLSVCLEAFLHILGHQHCNRVSWMIAASITFNAMPPGMHGGLIVIGLYSRGWSVDEYLREFIRLATRAFTRRPRLPFLLIVHRAIDYVLSFVADSWYSADHVEGALKEAFGTEQNMFTVDNNRTKVAVTATTTISLLCIFTNSNHGRVRPADYGRYQRPPPESQDIVDMEGYTPIQPYNARTMVWEAARCTSAAPCGKQILREGLTKKKQSRRSAKDPEDDTWENLSTPGEFPPTLRKKPPVGPPDDSSSESDKASGGENGPSWYQAAEGGAQNIPDLKIPLRPTFSGEGKDIKPEGFNGWATELSCYLLLKNINVE